MYALPSPSSRIRGEGLGMLFDVVLILPFLLVNFALVVSC